MAVPHWMAARVVGRAVARNPHVRGAAGGLAAKGVWGVARATGARAGQKAGVEALRSQGVRKRAAKKAVAQASNPPNTFGGQLASVSSHPFGAFAIGGAAVGGGAHWMNQPRDERGRWTSR